MKKYLIDGSTLPPEERYALFVQIDKLSYSTAGWPPDITVPTFSFFYEGDIEELKQALHITCPVQEI